VHNKILSIIVQRDATISRPFIYCKVTLHVSCVVDPSSGVHKTVTTASGTDRTVKYRGLTRRCI